MTQDAVNDQVQPTTETTSDTDVEAVEPGGTGDKQPGDREGQDAEDSRS